MEHPLPEGEHLDAGKVRFQQELNRWFESRGVIADLRSHLRHLMITALQNTQVGGKATDGSSPKAQALNLMVAEYLFRHGCHYALSVFTSEVPTLADFDLRGGKVSDGGKKRRPKNSFQENEVDEIFDALGVSAPADELAHLKSRYLEKGNDASLVELFLQMTVRMGTKLRIRQNPERHAARGERLLSEEWSSRVADVLLGEKLAPAQVSAAEETIFRITESETRRIVEEERKSQLEILSVREKRIQEYLRRHEDEILLRLTEAENELTARKDAIDEELAQREKHLTKMAVEWTSRHQDILRLSKKFHNIEQENRNLKKKVKDLEEDKKQLKAEGESQSRTINDLRGELNSLINKLKEVTDSNAILSERVEALITRDSREVVGRQDGANQPTSRTEIPLLWPKNADEDLGPKAKPEEFEVKGLETSTNESSAEDEDDSTSSSFAEIIQGVQKKLQVLEEESSRLNQSYLQYKLKCVSVDSDSESSDAPPVKSPPRTREEVETKFSQTKEEDDDTFLKIQKLKETKDGKYGFDVPAARQPEAPPKTETKAPTKRQLQHREFFLRSRQLVQELERSRDLQTSTSTTETSTTGETPEESMRSSPKGSQPGNEPDAERKSVESSRQLPKSDADCLALLEEARIKSPQASGRRPLRQQMLLSESEKDNQKEDGSSADTSDVSVGRRTGSDGFW